MCALLAALRESHRMYCKTCLCWTPCIRALVILAHRLRDDSDVDADDTTRFSCCSAFFVCSRGVYATVRRFFWTVHALRKLKLKFGNPNNEHIRTQPSQAVKILIPLPFQDSVNRKSDRAIPKVAEYLSSKIYYLCQICMRCVYFVPAPRVATISKSICVESYSSLKKKKLNSGKNNRANFRFTRLNATSKRHNSYAEFKLAKLLNIHKNEKKKQSWQSWRERNRR